MILFVYRMFLAPLTVLALPLIALFNSKLRRGLRLRMLRREIPRFDQAPIWIHASSGEFEYAKPVIRELKDLHPTIPIVVTYFSPTFALSVENFPGVDFALPLPLDLPGPCASFLNRIKPRRLLIARTDFWPEMLSQVRRRKIPIQVFSYTQKEVKNAAWIIRFRTNLVDQLDCVSEQDLQNLNGLSVSPVLKVLGDTRYDQVRYRLDRPKLLPEPLKPILPCLVAGSTWPEDERVLLLALKPLLLTRKLQLILVPHEPSEGHIQNLRSELRFLGISYALYSHQQAWDDKAVLLVDKVGVLAELYQWGQLAFVGGSFRKSVHSVMEALGAGCVTIVGPKHSNSREALEFQAVEILGRKALVTVNSAGELGAAVETALSANLTPFREALVRNFNQHLGATKKLVSDLAL